MRMSLRACFWMVGLLTVGACQPSMPTLTPAPVNGAVPSGGSRPGGLTPAQLAAADKGIPPYTEADVRFMQGMIGHHAQAVTMSAWAATNALGKDVKVLAERIAVAQADEIAFMQRWLRERGQTVPDPASAEHDHAMMAGMNHEMPGMTGAIPMMPGMLTPEQMKTLQGTTGDQFDRLFLEYMMQHHRGALTMVDELFSARGAGQDDLIFKFASDVQADQSTEIARMQSMLDERAKRSAP